ncbi:hypothetical protein [Rubritalea tangerina]|uniref:Peptidase C39-like domain-containing protein n=1 Tax=Rubritalea tangerina TaxID=430798 RepID=A0ABW4Z9Z7_9BACT
MKFLATCILLLSLGLPAQANYWKHDAQQGKVSACHCFAVIALVEAAYWQNTGQYLNLSERDLFYRHYAHGSSQPAELIQKQLISAGRTKLPQHHNEAGHLSANFSLMQKYGVASEKELPYNPLFSTGVAMTVEKLRRLRDQFTADAKLGHWGAQTTTHMAAEYAANQKSLTRALTLPPHTKTRQWTQKWLSQFTLKKVKPATSATVKSNIISQLSRGPVAVDVSNFDELISKRGYATRYYQHSLVVSHYDPQADLFTIRSSTHKGSKQVSAKALSRGTYQLYYLQKNG